MLFDSTTLLLRSIIQTLEKNDGTGWDDYVELGKQCLYELHQMARSSSRTYKPESNPNSRPHALLPAPERAIRAIPHMKLMNAAIREENRQAAIESGKAAIAEMNGVSALHVVVPPAVLPKAESEVPPAKAEKAPLVAKSRTRSAPKRIAQGKPRPSRALATSSR
jgi:hypothetical protein